MANPGKREGFLRPPHILYCTNLISPTVLYVLAPALTRSTWQRVLRAGRGAQPRCAAPCNTSPNPPYPQPCKHMVSSPWAVVYDVALSGSGLDGVRLRHNTLTRGRVGNCGRVSGDGHDAAVGVEAGGLQSRGGKG